MRSIAVAAIATILLLVAAAPAVPHERVTLDADDSAGPLDIVVTRLKHPGDQLRLLLVTYEQWGDTTISDDLDYVRFDLARGDRRGIERCIVVRLHPAEGGGVKASDGRVYRNCYAPLPYYDQIGTADVVTRPDGHSLELSVNRRTLWKTDPRKISFRAFTSYEDDAHPACQRPDPYPPEHFEGTCSDATAWRSH